MDTNTTNIIEVEKEALTLRSNLSALAITSQASYDAAVAARINAKSWLKDAETYFDGLVKPAYDAYVNLREAKKKVIEPVENTIKTINNALIAWDAEQERIRRAEQAKIEAEAQRKAEEARLAEAEQLEAAGASDAVLNEFLDAPVVVYETAIAQATYQKSSAVTYRDNYSAEVVDMKAFVKFIAKNPTHIGLLSVNGPALNAMARAMKDTLEFPGVKVVNNRVVAGRG